MDVLDILKEAQETFKERAKIYGDNYKLIGKVMKVFFPDDMMMNCSADDYNRFHLWFMILVKVTRLACCNFDHKDSAHDIMVYGAMLESESTLHVTGYSAKFHVVDNASDELKKVAEELKTIPSKIEVMDETTHPGFTNDTVEVFKCTFLSKSYWLRRSRLFEESVCDAFGNPFAGHDDRFEYFVDVSGNVCTNASPPHVAGKKDEIRIT